MERIELGDVLLIAEIHTGIDAKRLARMDRVVALTQSALAAPFAGFGDVELYPTLGVQSSDLLLATGLLPPIARPQQAHRL